MPAPHGYEKKQSRLARQKQDASDTALTAELTATGFEIVPFSIVAEKVTFQGSGTLTGTVEFSVDGKVWYGSTAIAASGAPATYSTHLSKLAKVTWASGAGHVTLAMK